MRALGTLPVLLALNLASTKGTARIEADKVAPFPAVHLDHVDSSPRQTPQLTPTQPCQESEAIVDRNRRSSAADLLASLPRAGGAKGVREGKNKVRLSPRATLGRAVTVNAMSWAAVVGGTVLWTRTKMGPKEGLTCSRSSVYI